MRRLCDECRERYGVAQTCNGDGTAHRHGMIHAKRPDGTYRLAWLCGPCGLIDRERWKGRPDGTGRRA
jgi:hypothetical protein